MGVRPVENSPEEKALIKKWKQNGFHFEIEHYNQDDLTIGGHSPYNHIWVKVNQSKYNQIKIEGKIEKVVDSLKQDLYITLNPNYKFDTLIIFISMKIPKEKGQTYSPEFDTTNDYLEVFQKKYKGNAK
ncbi:MAG: hypothetical protein ACJAZY_000023 [Spirosomataceae bacterium]|jgi:hypothetical protein